MLVIILPKHDIFSCIQQRSRHVQIGFGLRAQQINNTDLQLVLNELLMGETTPCLRCMFLPSHNWWDPPAVGPTYL